MRKITASELARQAVAVEEAFNDTCTVQEYTGVTRNSFGEAIKQYASLGSMDCSFAPSSKYEYQDELGQLVVLHCDAVLRVALTKSLSPLDLVTVHGKTFTVDGVVKSRSARIATLLSLDTDEIEGDDGPS